jgi:hypothetical protein
MRIVTGVVVLLVVFVGTAVAQIPARQVAWPTGQPQLPQVKVGHAIPGFDLNQRIGHPGPVAPQEIQLLRAGWQYVSFNDQPVPGQVRRIYHIATQDEKYSPVFNGAFSEEEVFWRHVQFTSNAPAPPPNMGRLRPSWSLTGNRELTLDYYWARVPVLVDIWEVKTEETFTRIGILDP